jgi:hypothetical protein
MTSVSCTLPPRSWILHPDLGEQFGGGELADVVHVAAVIGSLQAHEIQLGLAQEAFHVEIGRDVAVPAAVAPAPALCVPPGTFEDSNLAGVKLAGTRFPGALADPAYCMPDWGERLLITSVRRKRQP